MKTLNETFEDDDFANLQEAKGDKTWKEWLLEKAEDDLDD